MEEGGGTMVYHKTFKPQGKMRRRIKDLRISRFSYLDTAGCRAQPDLSHNESVRLAVDSLLTQGLEAYHKMLSAEGEVDFLSELEKTYVLQNGTDVSAGGAPDAFDDQFESLSAFSQTTLTYKMTSADSDRTLTPCRQNGVTSTNNGSDEPTVQIYFPSDIRAAGIKDVVRNFIREAKMALAIVMECFSDVELLCDVLVACKKRNVSVHLLLDRSNLDLFVDMWRELRLDGKNFPKFSVRSVVGHTYCARTGRRLTGQIAESFVISDWTAALTGTYSFSWLSGQVHRCHAVLVKGSAVLPFHQEFHRLNSSSTPVLGFATYMSVPQTLPLYIYNSVHACQKDQDDDDEVKLAWTEDTQNPNTQTRAKPEPVAKLQSSVSERTEDKDKDNTQNPQLELEPPNSLVTTDAKPLEKLSNHNSGSSDPPSDSLISTIQSDLSSLTITSVAGQVLESNPQQTAPPLSKQHRLLRTYLKPEVANRHGAEGPGFQQRQRYGLFRVLGTAARTNMQRRDWSCPQNLKPRVNLQSTCSQALSLSIPVKKDKNARFFSFLTHAKEHILKPHESFHNRPQAQDQPDQYHYRSHFQSHLSGEFLVSGPSINIRRAQHQPGSTMLSPHIRTIRTTSEPDPTQFRLAAHHSSVGSAYEAVQRARWRSCLGSLRQSIRLNHRYHILNLVQEHD